MILLVGAMTLTCCQKETPGPQSREVSIVATLFPLYDFARQITGDKARVVLLLPPGVEAHSFEPRPGDLMSINKADLFLYTGNNMEPWVPKVLHAVDNKQLTVVDTSKGVKALTSTKEHSETEDVSHEGHSDVDPHIWLDFSDAQVMVDNILNGLKNKDTRDFSLFLERAAGYQKRLEDLDQRFKNTLSHCDKHIFIHAGHSAFNYLANRYNLQYVSAYAGSPNAEPTPRRLIELKEIIRKNGIKYIYYEELIRPRIAEVLSRETGVKLLKLNGAHNITKDEAAQGKTFIDLMEENLANLKVGLECR
ncbi:MAG TPA: zinc ABC transporter substrate-binding protein [Syntrophorhabdaceae bacterium]|nr:zinc ABC transporter substrate-binding protein [Syntrophorhabdaceae bacterium]